MYRRKVAFVLALGLLSFVSVGTAAAQSTLNCQTCHSGEKAAWATSVHAHTQSDVASELASDDIGSTPSQVVQGEDCVACHGPTAIAANGGMSEAGVMAHFFTTTDSLYTDSTTVADTTNWPHVACTACHNVPADHPSTMPTLSIFNSFSGQYASVSSVPTLCGQCHGNLRFPDTDHRTYNAWLISRHGHGGQADVASELSSDDIGKTPSQVVQDEDCVACHAPTAVTMNGGISEAQVLSTFFTTTGGAFTSGTAPADTADYPNVACNTCHDPHNPGVVSYFNSTTKSYEVMSSPDSLCGQCHGNLRFPDTDHLSYNISMGTGGIGVPDQVMMDSTTCIDCHMVRNDVDGLNSTMYHGHTWSVFITEPDSSVTSACTRCHAGMSVDSAEACVADWKAEFATQDSIAEATVAMADSALTGSTDSTKLSYLHEAQYNMTYAESDESGGVHNHSYSMALLNDAIAKADLITTGVTEAKANTPTRVVLLQNEPNPFNPETTIRFEIPQTAHVRLTVYDILGRQIRTLVDGRRTAGEYSVTWDGHDALGHLAASGVYVVRLDVGSTVRVRRMTLVR